MKKDNELKTYLVAGFYYRIVKAESPIRAWIEYITKDVDIKNKRIWSKEDARLELIKRGFKKLQVTNVENVYEIFKKKHNHIRGEEHSNIIVDEGDDHECYEDCHVSARDLT